MAHATTAIEQKKSLSFSISGTAKRQINTYYQQQLQQNITEVSESEAKKPDPSLASFGLNSEFSLYYYYTFIKFILSCRRVQIPVAALF